MPDAARVAQARALEVPVIVSGAKTVAGTERRELFTENARTTLVFDDGVILNLQWKVTVGQVVFLHNEQNKREVLCHVMAVPAEGASGATELQFTAVSNDFWNVPGQQSAAHIPTPEIMEMPAPQEASHEAAAHPEMTVPPAEFHEVTPAEPEAREEAVHEAAAHPEMPVPQEAIEPQEAIRNAAVQPAQLAAMDQSPEPTEQPAPLEASDQVAEQAPPREASHEAPEDSLAMMRSSASEVSMPSMREELVAAHEIVPETSAVIVSTPEAPPEPAPETSSSGPSGDEIDAALRKISVASYPADSPQAAAALAQTPEASDPDAVESEANLAALMARDARFAKYAAIKEKQVEKIQRDAAAKDVPQGAPGAAGEHAPAPVAAKTRFSLDLTAGKNALYIQIAAGVLVVVALGFVGHALRGIFFPKSGRPVAVATPSPAKPAASSAPAPKQPAPAAAPATAVTSSVPATPPTIAPASATTSSPAASTARIGAPQPAVAPKAAVPAPKAEGARAVVVESGDIAGAEAKRRKAAEPEISGDVPARILSQPQPTFPAWAKSLDVDGVVTLDAVIDEKGNVAQTKVLSGPRQLQHAAEQAVGLWEFEPAKTGGTPVSSHMVLTVKFQR